jgi:D-arabinan exo alpha-(1,3)/(1,5)-arabinofuranosidase (non-reducing end)
VQKLFANQVRVDQPMTQGNNVLTRARNLDEIPFTQSLDFNFELISWRPTRLNYAMTTYWYAFSGAVSSIHPQPDAATRAVPSLMDAQKKQIFLK